MTKKIVLASDHAGFWLKEQVKDFFSKEGYVIEDVGCFTSTSCDYPDFAHALAQKIENGECDMGVAICSTGNGITMTANKHQNIRAALCWNAEIASFARKHNDANVIGLPANFITPKHAIEIIQIALSTDFEGGRHKRRVDKIPCQQTDKSNKG